MYLLFTKNFVALVIGVVSKSTDDTPTNKSSGSIGDEVPSDSITGESPSTTHFTTLGTECIQKVDVTDSKHNIMKEDNSLEPDSPSIYRKMMQLNYNL